MSAFQFCNNLESLTIPASYTSLVMIIDRDVTLYVEPGSYAESFAKLEGFDYEYIPSTP